MITLVDSICSFFIQLFIPPFCVYCAQWLKKNLILCDQCRSLIKPVIPIPLKITASFSVQVIALSLYDEPLKTLILAKSNGNRLASKQLGTVLVEMLPQLDALSFDYITPIPLHWTRYAYRGYNQAEVMGLVIAKKYKKPIVSLLTRTKRTPFQSHLPIEERENNVKGVFDVTFSLDQRKLYEGKHLLLIDDLMTTGSTIRMAIKKLLRLKPSSITVVVACRRV